MSGEALAQALRLRIHRVFGDEVICFCPFHKGGKERKPSFSLSRTKGVYCCHTCGGGTVQKLVQKILALSPSAAIEWLRPFGVLESLPADGYMERFQVLGTPIAENALAPFRPVPRGVARKLGFPTALLRREGVLYDTSADRCIFPVRGPDGSLSAVLSRSMGGKIPKYLFYAGARSTSLLGIDRVRGECLYVVEGPRDWLSLRRCVQNSVALLGCSLSRQQRSMILDSGVAEVVDVLDADLAGRSGGSRLGEFLGRSVKIRRVDWSRFPKAKDPAELKTMLDVRLLLRTARRGNLATLSE